MADIRETGRICVLDVELQGVHSFKSANFDAKYIFIRPPSLEVLVSFYSFWQLKILIFTTIFHRKIDFDNAAPRRRTQLPNDWNMPEKISKLVKFIK